MIHYPFERKTNFPFPLDFEASIPLEKKKAIYFSMLRIRRIEEEIERQYHLDKMKSPIHLVIGQEAASVGPCEAMEKSDWLYATHRTHGNYLAKGGSLKMMMSELYCRTTGCVASRGGSMHLMDKSVGMEGSSAICGGGVPIATGAALKVKMAGEKRAVATFFGDGASEEGVIWESLNFAALKKLPILYVLENNFYSVCSPLFKRQPPHVELWKKAQAFGLESYVIDGTQALEVYEASRSILDRVRKGEGPFLLEVRAYRWRAHGGAGDDSAKLGYRDIAEVKEWEAHDPITILEKKLQLKKEEIEGMEEKIKVEIEEAFRFAEESPSPGESDLYQHIYAE